MPVTITTKGYITVWRDGVQISSHTVETKAVESAIAHAEEFGEGDYELRFPNKVLMSRLRKTVLPISWNTITVGFTQGTASSVNLAPFLDNKQNRSITYTSTTLPSGVTLSGSTLSYNGSGAAAATTATFTATSGGYEADSALTTVRITAVVTGNLAPIWQAGTISLGDRTNGGTQSLIGYVSDIDGPLPLVFGRTGDAGDTAPGSITVNSSGLMSIPSGLTPGTYTVRVYAEDGYGLLPQVSGFVATPAYNRVTLSWAAVPTATSYTVQRSTNGTVWTSYTAPSTIYEDSTVSAETTYLYRVRAVSATSNGEYNTPITVVTPAAPGPAPDPADWAARFAAPGVVWGHRFTYPEELGVNYNPPGTADYGDPFIFGVHPPIVGPHVGTEDTGRTYFEETLIGAVLDQDMASATLATIDYPTATLTALTSRTATLTLPLEAASLNLTENQSVFKITSGANSGIYLDATSNPVTGVDSITITVDAGTRQAALVNQTGLTFQYCELGENTGQNPVQTIVIDEQVSSGGQWWPSPTGWSESTPTVVPADAYTVVVHAQYRGSAGVTFNGLLITQANAFYKWKDKLTVYRATYDAGTQKTTLVVRRAAMASGAGRLESDWVNRGFPCQFPAGTNIGRDNTGGWTRPLAALPAGQNGLPFNDPADGGQVRLRNLPVNRGPSHNFRSGYYAHADYHGIYTDANPRTPNTQPENGVLPYDGDEFWLAWSMKYSTTWGLTTTPAKTWFLDCYEEERNSQIVGNAPTADERRWRIYHNKDSDQNSTMAAGNSYAPGSQWENTCVTGSLNNPLDGSGPQTCWWPPLGEWFAVRLHIKVGHDNDIGYPYANGVTVTAVESFTPTQLIIRCVPCAKKSGMCEGFDTGNSYFQSAQNPSRLDPTLSGYFNNWGVKIEGYSANTFKIVSHTMVGGEARYVLEKYRANDTWPLAAPGVGLRVRVDWLSMGESTRYDDTTIEVHKKEAGDADWVLVASFLHSIAFSKGDPAPNPPGWNEFQPTGYANVNDNTRPPDLTRYIRTTDVILSRQAIAAPVTP